MAWKSLPLDVPTDTEVVYVRIKYYYGEPFLAEWDETLQEFTSVVNNIIYPAWSVSRWKSQ